VRAYVGGGWHIHHLTDRTIELRKHDIAYRAVTGKDGYVRVRVDPEMSRAEMVKKAIDLAHQNDERLAVIIGERMMPSKAALARYQGKQLRMAPAFRTPEDEKIIGRKQA